MAEFLKTLADNARKSIDDGNYNVTFTIWKPKFSMKNAIKNCKHIPVITEIKFASPSMGTIRERINPITIARDMVDAGCTGLSILTQPYMFNGSIDYLANIRLMMNIPLLMKDIMISDIQIEAAKKIGADCILLISSMFNENLCENSIEYFITKAHKLGLEVLLETHTEEEFKEAINSSADLVGINNRNLDTMHVDIKTTENILKKYEKNKLIISESGISEPAHIKYLKNVGADAFLIGTAIMQSSNIKDKVKELVMAY
ncbi:MAG: indole-3-glycerol-phosphate synthase [Thaumarchaeota archaeon]|nr:indole-3-glycerol-phosphate synthase [Nitrososphaerota archaeon]